MKLSSAGKMALRFGVVAALACFCVSHADSQDPTAKPNFGMVSLKAGFEPDPYSKQLVAGGPVNSKHGGVSQWVTNAPDFRLNYTAGEFALTIFAEGEPGSDTTLLVNLPDGKWLANDDGPNTGLNPLIKIAKPKSGQYDIWVGTLQQGKSPKATLKITELK